VSGGGITAENKWRDAKKSIYRYLFPSKAMSIVYRGKFLQALQTMIAKGEVMVTEGTDSKSLFDLLYQKDWVVYAKAPFGGPHAVIEYLGRYTHKVAISNHRIVSMDEEGGVTFDYKDYADGNKKKQMTLSSEEFIRRFKQHILPKGFTKIRTYGYLANRNRHQRINEILKAMKLPQHKGLVKVPIEIKLKERYGIDLEICPCCKARTLQLVQIYLPWKNADDG